MAPIEASEEELVLAARLLEAKSPEDLAVALVRAHASQMPSPEDLIDLSTRNNGRDSEGRERPQHHREGFDDTVWFRMDIGRSQRADPRWILPLLCRRGHITRDEIGAIRIAANETFFQIPRAVEAKFRAALARTAVPGSEDESGIVIEPSDGTPRDSAKSNARGHERIPAKPHRGSVARSDAPREHRPTEHRPTEHRVADHRDGGGAGGAAVYSGQPPAHQPYSPPAHQVESHDSGGHESGAHQPDRAAPDHAPADSAPAPKPYSPLDSASSAGAAPVEGRRTTLAPRDGYSAESRPAKGKPPFREGGLGKGAPYKTGSYKDGGGKAPYKPGGAGKAPYKGGPGKAYAAPRGDAPRGAGFKGKPSGGGFKGKPPRGR